MTTGEKLKLAASVARTVGAQQVALSALLLLAASAHAGPPVIDTNVAGLYVGQAVTIEATVTSTQRDGNVVRLRLGSPPQQVDIALIEGLLSNFPPNPEKFYADKTVRVAGVLQRFHGTLEIRVLGAADIQLVEPTKPQPAAAGNAGADAERLRQLEDRIRQLEAQPTATSPLIIPDSTPTGPMATATALPSAAPTAGAPTPTAETVPSPTPTTAPVTGADQSPLTIENLDARLKRVEIRVRELERAMENAR